MVLIQKLETVWVAAGHGVDAVNDIDRHGERGPSSFLEFAPRVEAHEAQRDL